MQSHPVWNVTVHLPRLQVFEKKYCAGQKLLRGNVDVKGINLSYFILTLFIYLSVVMMQELVINDQDNSVFFSEKLLL